MFERVSARGFLGGLVVLCTMAACGDAEPTGGDPIPSRSGAFVGSYRVPTVTPELEPAALFPVDHVDWTVVDGLVTLHYDFPVGLVGGDLDVTLTGTLEPGATELHVSGPAGTGVCTATGAVISCLEDFTGLPPLPISMRVVEQQAAVEYAGPVGDRTTVATVFGSDPIGVVELDTSRLAPDDGNDD